MEIEDGLPNNWMYNPINRIHAFIPPHRNVTEGQKYMGRIMGRMDMEVVESCRRAVETGRLDREDCIRMLGYDADSEESRFIIDTADRVMRERNGNTCSIGGRSVSSPAPASRTAVSADSRSAPRERMIT